MSFAHTWLLAALLLLGTAPARADTAGSRARTAIAQLSASVALVHAGDAPAAELALTTVRDAVQHLAAESAGYRRSAEHEQQRCVKRVAELETRIGDIFTQETDAKRRLGDLAAELTTASADFSLNQREVEALKKRVDEAHKLARERANKLQEFARWWWVPGYGQYLLIRTLVHDDIGNHRSLMNTLHDRGLQLQRHEAAMSSALAMICELGEERDNLQVTATALSCMRDVVHQRAGELKRATVLLQDSEVFWQRLQHLTTVSVENHIADLELTYGMLQQSSEAAAFVQGELPGQAKTLEQLLVALGDSMDTGNNLLLQSPTDYCLLDEPSAACGAAASAVAAGIPSSFHATCAYVNVAGSKLSARCKNKKGELKETSVTLQSIGNRDGTLVAGSKGSQSTFQQTCQDSVICGSTLRSRCKKYNGTLNETALSIMGIHNMDGKLTY